jgi:hypothetical protein
LLFGVSGKVIAVLTTFLSFLGSVGLGASSLTGKEQAGTVMRIPHGFILAVATPLFMASLVSLLSLVVDQWLVHANMPISPGQFVFRWEACQATRSSPCFVFPSDPAEINILWRKVILLAGAMFASFIGALAASRVININRFSLHDVYRLRLMQEFLGAANPEHDQREDGYTQFTHSDDEELADLWSPPPRSRCLYPLINRTLNLVRSNRLAWQERKGEPFIFTPMYVGSVRLGYSSTASVAGRVLLSTAITASGAAVSPNSGYISNPALTLLMTMFNLRLGLWVADPRCPATHQSRGPRGALKPLLTELFGRTTEENTSGHVFISDGGHYDNLGLYEALRRRCRYIVVSDAGHDPSYTYEDLGRALRQAAIDIGVRVTFSHLDMARRPKPGETPPLIGGIYSAVADIEYPETDPATKERARGALLYFKPGYLGKDEPADVRAFASRNPAFPHDPTLNQFFGEAQFESYRQLGSYTVMQLAGLARFVPAEDVTLGKFFTLVRSALAKISVPGRRDDQNGENRHPLGGYHQPR